MSNDASTSKGRPGAVAVWVEVILGLFGFYGIGHLISKRWLSGIGFFLFSFLWLFAEVYAKDVILVGDYPTGLCALAFHVPIMLISVSFLRSISR